MRKDIYESPLSSRYASEYMLHLFSPDMRFQTWRRLWVALARAEHELGLPITQEQVDELAAHITDIDYEVAEKREYSEHFGSALRKVFPRERVRPRPQQTDEQTRKGYTRKRKIRRRRKGGQQIRSRKQNSAGKYRFT